MTSGSLRTLTRTLLGLWATVGVLSIAALLCWFPWRGPSAVQAQQTYDLLVKRPRTEALAMIESLRSQRPEWQRALFGNLSVEQELDEMLASLRSEAATFRRKPVWGPVYENEFAYNLGADGVLRSDLMSPARAWERFLREAIVLESAALLMFGIPGMMIYRKVRRSVRSDRPSDQSA